MALSADPVAAGEWYKKYFGVTGYIGPRKPRVYRGVHLEPVASLQMDNVERLRRDGIKVAANDAKSAFIEGPDQIRIEPLEDQARKG